MTLRDDALTQAQSLQGIPYRISPPPDGVNNLDCSLFVEKVFSTLSIPFAASVRTAEQIRQVCTPIDWSDVQLCDLLFFENTYDAGQAPGPDGHLATHVGFSLGKGTQRMWDCHATGDSGPPGVGQTDISTAWWQQHLFDARRPPQFAATTAPAAGTRYQLTDAGVRLRSAPGTAQPILVQDLGKGTIVTALNTQVVAADGFQWRNVHAPQNDGWVDGEFLQAVDGSAPQRYRVSEAGVRMRVAAGTDQPVLVENLGAGTIVESVEDQVVAASGLDWRHVQAPQGVGYVAAEYLQLLSGDSIRTRFGDAPADLSDAVRRLFPAAEQINAAEVAHVESQWNPRAFLDTVSQFGPCGTQITLENGNPAVTERSRGYFQLNGCAHPEWDSDDFFDCDTNVGAAVQLFNASGWQAWYYSAKSLGLL
jgi:hypothetical protein